MPFISIDGPKINKETKSHLVKELTKSASKVYNLPEEHITVIIRENETDNVGQGGKLISDIIEKNK